MSTPAQQVAAAIYGSLSNRPLSPLTYGSVVSYVTILVFEIFVYRPDIVDTPNRIAASKPAFDFQTTFDFVVVGSGSAGSVVASRLSENPRWQVLLIEAGGGEPLEAEIPFITPELSSLGNLNWNFETELSTTWALSQGNRCKWARGKVLGGSSILNTVAYVRGSRRDFDQWRDGGNPGWGYKDVLPYFKKSENMRIPELLNSPFHGRSGYLSIEHLRYQTPITDVAIQAAKELGIYNEDVNGFTQVGVTRTQCNLRDGLRHSLAKAFLRPAKWRPNLHISLNSQATKVLINPVTKVAEGVQFLKNISGLTLTKMAYVRNEVILSAGAVQSPQLLMLSGVGPSDHLSQKGIYTIVNSPGVGQNLQDHVAVGGVTYIINNDVNIGPWGTSAVTANVLTDLSRTLFTRFKTGPLYSLPRSEANMFANSKYNKDPNWPDIQVVIIPTGTNSDGGLFDRVGNGITEEAYNRMFGDYMNNFSMTLSPVFSRPFSRGSIRLRDSNPFSAPLIYAPYYNDPNDMKYMIEACNIAHRFTKAPAFRRFNLTLVPNKFPGCEKYPFLSDGYWECQARHFTSPFWHPCGTCKMGPRTDRMAVVDSRLRVHGVQRLRVIDASIMPFITSGNINAPTIMIGEKGASLIKEDWSFGWFS